MSASGEAIFSTFMFCEGGWQSLQWLRGVYVGPIWVKRDA